MLNMQYATAVIAHDTPRPQRLGAVGAPANHDPRRMQATPTSLTIARARHW